MVLPIMLIIFLKSFNLFPHDPIDFEFFLTILNGWYEVAKDRPARFIAIGSWSSRTDVRDSFFIFYPG